MEIDNEEEDIRDPGQTNQTEEEFIEELVDEDLEEGLSNESIEIHLPSGFICKLSSLRYSVFDLSNLIIELHKHFNNSKGEKGKPGYT